MVGTRELLFGALLLGAKTPETRRAAVLASAAVDALDLAATIWGWEIGQVSVSLLLVALKFCHQVFGLCLGWSLHWAGDLGQGLGLPAVFR